MSEDIDYTPLVKRLIKADLFDEYFGWWAAERPSFTERLEWLEKHNISTSQGAIYRLHKSTDALEWRLKEAGREKADLGTRLAGKVMDDEIRELLLQQRFNHVLGDLTHKELMDHGHLDVAQRRMKLLEKTEPEKLKLVERKVAMLEAKVSEGKKVLENTKLTPQERDAELRQIFGL